MGVPLSSHCGRPRGKGSGLEVGFHYALTSLLTLAPVLGTRPSDASDTAFRPAFQVGWAADTSRNGAAESMLRVNAYAQ